MKVFTLITGVITLVSFVIQMNDIFPKHRDVFEKITFILLGILVGLIISFFDKNKIKVRKFTANQTFGYIFYTLIGLAFIVLFVSIFFTEDKEKIKILQTVMSSLGLFTFVSFFFVLKMFSSGNNLNTDERIILAEKYFSERNFSRSLSFYIDLEDALDEEDIRLNRIQERIKEIKNAQIESHIGK